jgi:hypothetical protein
VIQLYRRDCWDPINVCLYMFCRWRSSYIEDGWDPINVCLYMFCHGRTIYIEGKVGIPLTFVYICFYVGDPDILKGLLGSHYGLLIYVCRWRSSYIEKIVGIPLTFVYICFAVGDPVI